MEENRIDEEEIDLLELFFALWKKAWILALALVIAGTATFCFSKFCLDPVYESTSKLFILTKTTSITSLADIQMGSSLTKDYVELIQSRPVVEQVIENLGINRTYEEMLEQIEVVNKSDTRIIAITAKDTDPVLAKDIVDQFAQVASERISVIMKTDAPSVVEYGIVSDKKVEPSNVKNAAIGGALAFFVAAAIIIVLHLLDDTIKTAEDVDKYLKLNVLTAVPMAEEEKKTKKLGKGGKKNGK